MHERHLDELDRRFGGSRLLHLQQRGENDQKEQEQELDAETVGGNEDLSVSKLLAGTISADPGGELELVDRSGGSIADEVLREAGVTV